MTITTHAKPRRHKTTIAAALTAGVLAAASTTLADGAENTGVTEPMWPRGQNGSPS